MKRQKVTVGDVFRIEISNGEHAYGQILSVEKEALNSIGCAFWEPSDIDLDSTLFSLPIAVLLVTPDLYKKGIWKRIESRPEALPNNLRPYEIWRSNDWVGAKVIGSGIVVKLLEACCGLHQWDAWSDPDYFNKLLFNGASVPSRATFKSCS